MRRLDFRRVMLSAVAGLLALLLILTTPDKLSALAQSSAADGERRCFSEAGEISCDEVDGVDGGPGGIRPPGLLAAINSGSSGGTSSLSSSTSSTSSTSSGSTDGEIGDSVRVSIVSRDAVPMPQPADPAASSSGGVGGERANPAEARWQAQIYQPWSMAYFRANGVNTTGRRLWELQHLCGGVLIARDWILTAAHCLDNASGRRNPPYRVRLGVIDFAREGGWTYAIDRVERFPLYRDPAPGQPPRTRYDIALVHFIRDAASRADTPPAAMVSAIAIDNRPPPPDGDDVYATGWGVMAGQEPTSVMMKIDLDVVGDQRCAALWRTARNPTVICAGGAGVQTCQGDSGGPLVNRHGPPRLIGIVSYNLIQCRGRADRPGVYTRVATPEYIRWIRQIAGVSGRQ